MDIEKIKANKPEGAEYFNAVISNGSYYRIIGEVAQYYSKFHKEWVDSTGYTKDEVQELFIDLREKMPLWTPENNTLPFGELTREQKIALFAAWVDGGVVFALYCGRDFIKYENQDWINKYVYQVRKSPRTAFIEQCKDLSAAEIYDAIKSGKLKID